VDQKCNSTLPENAVMLEHGKVCHGEDAKIKAYTAAQKSEADRRQSASYSPKARTLDTNPNPVIDMHIAAWNQASQELLDVPHNLLDGFGARSPRR
jgi:hypothetical protein